MQIRALLILFSLYTLVKGATIQRDKDAEKASESSKNPEDIPVEDEVSSNSGSHEVKKRSPQVITTVMKKILSGVGRTIFKAGEGVGTILPPFSIPPAIIFKTGGTGIKALSKVAFGLLGFLT